MPTALLVIALVARFGVGLILILAGGAKLASSREMVERLIGAYGLVPKRVLPWVARALPLTEVTVGIWLVAGLFVAAAALAAIVLLSVLTLAVAQALLRKRSVPCGCFGPGDATRPISWRIVARNASMAAVLVLVVVSQQ
jgi:uncharacterized membrane protein YphA (DoxX/SURF4 family)